MRKIVKKKLKGAVAKVKDLHQAWVLFKNTILEAQISCILSFKKSGRKSKKLPAWFKGEIREAVVAKKASFRKWKKEPNDETWKQHKHWHVKCKALIRQAKGEFEKKLAAEAKTHNKDFFKYIHSKKPVRESVGPLFIYLNRFLYRLILQSKRSELQTITIYVLGVDMM